MEATESATARRVIAGLTVFVFAAVGLVLYAVPASSPSSTGGPDVLATVNATLNGASALCLVLGYVFIKKKQIERHRLAMLTAFSLSSLFLVTYLLHHARVGHVKFEGTGVLRGVYLALLVPHIALAAIIVPLALITIRRGWVRDVVPHRAIARRTLPLWLYVSVSGVVLYFMLYH